MCLFFPKAWRTLCCSPCAVSSVPCAFALPIALEHKPFGNLMHNSELTHDDCYALAGNLKSRCLVECGNGLIENDEVSPSPPSTPLSPPRDDTISVRLMAVLPCA